MKRNTWHRLVLNSLLLTLLCMGVQCGKKDEPATTQQDSPITSPLAPPKPPSLVDHAARLGFAARLPLETEFYLGSVNLKSHLTALQASAWWKEINARVQDKTPAPTAGDKSVATLEKMWGDDLFIAGGQGFATGAAQLRNLNRVYNEVYFKMLMAGTAAGALGGGAQDGSKQEGSAPNPMLYLNMFLQDPATLEKVSGLISSFELPPLIAGFKVEKPDEILATLGNTKELEQKKIFVMSELKTPQGQTFRVATVDMANVLTEDDQESALSKLPSSTPEESKQVIAKTYAELRKKKFMLAWGAVDGHVVFACGQNLDHLKFAASPGQSLLAKPELAWLLPHAQKNLTTITYASAGTLNALNDDQPVVPMLRGVASAMKENPMFSKLGSTIEKQIAELAPVESKVYATEATNLVMATWWDRGLHAEATGGIKPKFILPGKPLHFHPLVLKPGVVLGVTYHRDMEHEKVAREWMERLIGIAYSAVQELIKAGIAGPQGGQSFALFNLALLPMITNVYQADKDIAEKGLGPEIAYILDLNGKMPPLPTVPETAKDIPFPRLSSVSEVASRAELAKGWTTINETVTGIASLATMFGGQPAADGQGKPPFEVPQPKSTQAGGMTTWTYAGEFLSGDLNPCATVSDKLLVLSSSKEAAESIAAEVAKAPATSNDCLVLRLDPAAAANWVAKASVLNPTTTPEQAKELQQAVKWLQPFHALQGRISQEKGQWRFNLDWEMADLVKFD